MRSSRVDPGEIVCLGISGHSLGAVPVDADGTLLREATPIWSDIRAARGSRGILPQVDPDDWYLTTGNGFPAACYTVFKVMWYRRPRARDVRKNPQDTRHQGLYQLQADRQAQDRLLLCFRHGNLRSGGLGIYLPDSSRPAVSPAELWPEIVPSTQILGQLTAGCCRHAGSCATRTKVVCGGVDNSCMALGAKNIRAGRVYTSLGSSAWIAVSCGAAGARPAV